MRYEMRMLDDGWAVWDTETNAPASVGGRWQTSLDMEVARKLVYLLNNTVRTSALPEPFPPAEEDLGGGDICSLQEQPSTDDDRPLE